MKRKFRSMGRVAIALVLALSLSLVMAAPVMAADGDGTCTVTPTEVMAGSTGNTLTFTFTAAESMDGGQISIEAPANWSAPQGTIETAGYTTASSDGAIGALQFAAQIVTVPITTLADTETITVVYGDGGGDSGAVAATPATSEVQTFITKSKFGGAGSLVEIAASPTVKVWVLHHFEVVPSPLTPVVGETSTVTITAQDSVDDDITIYPGENLDLNQANADEPANLTWSGADVFNDGDGTGRFVGNWTNGVCTVDVSYTKADNAVTLGVTGETTGKVGTSDPVTWGAVAILTIEGTAYQNGNDTIVIGFNTEVQPADEEPWDADVFTHIKCGETSLSLDGASYTPASGLTDTLTITLDETNDYLVFGQAMKVDPVTDAIKDASDNFVPTGEITGGNVSGDAVDPTFTIAYYTDDALTSLLVGDYMKVGTYYIKITASEALSATPTIDIAAEGAANNVDDGVTTAVGGSTKVFQYTRTIADDDAATGEAIEVITITGTDLAGNVATDEPVTGEKYTDTVVPTIDSIQGLTIEGAGDEIIIIFTEASTLVIATPAADAWTKDAFSYIKCGDVSLVLPDDSTSYVYDTLTLTITLDKDTEDAYLVNAADLAVKAVANAIQDAAGNAVSVDEVTGSVDHASNDDSDPALSTVVGTIQPGDDTITITFDEMVRPADLTWSANEFTIESPADAPLNINHATFAPATGMADSLTITLNEASDGAFLVVADTVVVTPVLNKVLDLAGLSLPTTPMGGAAAIADPTDPTIVSVVGTTIQDAGDTIVITFSEAVFPAEAEDPVWSTNEFSDIGGFTITTAVFSIDGTNTILTITLDEANDGDYLVNDDMVAVTPDSETIEDVDGNFVSTDEVTSTAAVSGETTLPTITSIVGWDDTGADNADNDVIRIDFSEAVVPNAVGDWQAMLPSIKCGTADVNIAGATFVPAFADIGATTTSVIITLDMDGEGFELTPGETLTVTPATDVDPPVATIVDLAGNEISTDPVVGEAVNEGYAIDLVVGWNLISLPLVPDSSVITDALSGLIAAGTVDEVRTYDQGVWSDWASTGPAGDLTIMKDGPSYWILMNAADVLVVAGVEIPVPPAGPKSYDVYTGWNMAGFKSLLSKTAEAYLGTAVTATVETMYGYDAASSVYTLLTTGSDLDPGAGYWLAVNDDGTIYP